MKDAIVTVDHMYITQNFRKQREPQYRPQYTIIMWGPLKRDPEIGETYNHIATFWPCEAKQVRVEEISHPLISLVISLRKNYAAFLL